MINAQSAATEAVGWLRQVAPSVFADRRDLHVDSRRLQRGDVFVALRGTVADGRDYLPEAARSGAAAALVDADGWNGSTPLPTLAVNDLRRLAGHIASEFYRRPSEHLLSIGVTGTNGKTSSTQWIAQLLTRAGRRCAVIGTLGVGFVDQPLSEGSLTTPDPVSLQREVRALLDAGAHALAMEVSSIALEQERLNGMKIDIALFTNLTRDHLDYHGTMERYEAAKSLLFDWPTLSHAVINLDDAAGRALISGLAKRGVDVIGYSASDSDDAYTELPLSHRLTARAIRATPRGLAFDAGLDGHSIPIEVPLVGQFNVENLLGVLGVMHVCGIDFARAVEALPQLDPPPGRMQQVAQADAPLVVIDYAHTPDALHKALTALRPLVTARGGPGIGGRLWVVFGAGGDRDTGKRAPMGGAAAQAADVVVITSDNPRTEDAATIASQVASGAADARTCATIIDRGQAIAHAITHAAPADVVLIAGKGHELYQVIGEERRPFSDLAEAQAALARRVGRAGSECPH